MRFAHTKWKAGKRTVGGKTYRFRSAWEFNYALYLEFQKQQKQIKDWHYEPETFWFEKIRRGTRSYTIDFRLTMLDDSKVFHEIKGYMDSKSATKIKRMKIYHPHISLTVIDRKEYKHLEKGLSQLLPGWEQSA